MAKSKSPLRLQGTFAGMTFVDSITYGPHIRSPRGTHTKAVVNSAYKKASQHIQSADVPAKILSDALKPFRDELSKGQFWQNLLASFYPQFSEKGKFDFALISPIEIHERHTFDRFLSVRLKIKPNKKKTALDLDIHYDGHPEFKGSKYTDGYRLRVIAVFPDLKTKNARTMIVDSNVIGLRGKVSPLLVRLAIPAKANRYVICLKIDGCTKGVVDRMLGTQGMKIVCAGKI